jgi:hypothetical protein
MSATPTPRLSGLYWCENCGDHVEVVNDEGECPACVERHLHVQRAEYQASIEILGATVEAALGNLHPDDLLGLVKSIIDEYPHAAAWKRPTLDELEHRCYELTLTREEAGAARHDARVDQELQKLLQQREDGE